MYENHSYFYYHVIPNIWLEFTKLPLLEGQENLLPEVATFASPYKIKICDHNFADLNIWQT